jgi:PhoH-like ATPase
VSERYVGFRTHEVDDNLINEIYKEGKVDVPDKRYSWYPNLYIELRSLTAPKHTALGRVDRTGSFIERIQEHSASDLKPRNREQVFALNALMDDRISVVVLTGPAGTGKTILTLAVALDKIQGKQYDRIIITKPMSQVGKWSLGALPGGIEEKFNPYLMNYMTNLEQFVGRKSAEHLIDQCKIEAVPLQLFRGASFNNCLVIADEVQVCDYMTTLTIGTRIGENSKLIMMGDLNQRDENIAKEKTGIYKLMNDKKVKESPLVAAIELQKCERSETARLFSEVFEE